MKQKQEKSIKTTNFIVTEQFTGKKELREILIELLYSAYCKQREN